MVSNFRIALYLSQMPYDFFLELLYPLPLRPKKMFGLSAFYIEEKIVFALCKKAKNIEDNGIWVACKKENHTALINRISSFRLLKNFGPKTWLLLPEDANDFEEAAQQLALLIKANNPMIGNIPKPRKPRN